MAEPWILWLWEASLIQVSLWKYKTPQNTSLMPLDIVTSSRTLSLEQEHPRLIVMSWSLLIVLLTSRLEFQIAFRPARDDSEDCLQLPSNWLYWRLDYFLELDGEGYWYYYRWFIGKEGDAVTKTACPNTELSSNSRSNQFNEGLAVSGVLSWKPTFLLFELWEWIIHWKLAELSQECFKQWNNGIMNWNRN